MNQAESLTSQNEHVIIEKYYIHLSRNEITQALAEADKIKDPELQKLLLIKAFLVGEQSLRNILENLNPGEKTFEKNSLKAEIYEDILSIIYCRTGNIQDFMNLYETQIADSLNQNYLEKIYNITCKALILFESQNKWKEGLTFLDGIYNKHPVIFQNHNSCVLKYYEFLFYNNTTHQNKAEEILNSFSNNKIFLTTEGLKIVAYTYEFAIYSALLNNNSVKLSLYEKNLATFPNNQKIKSVKELIQVFSKVLSETKKINTQDTTTKAEVLDAQIPESKLPEPIKTPTIIKPKSRSFAEIDMMIAAEDYEAISQLNQKTLGKYYVYKKLELQNQFRNITESKVGWTLKGKSIDEAQTVSLDQRSKFYGIIDKDLLASLDAAVIKKCGVALNKGFVGPKGEIGVKQIPKKLIELKIMEDTALYTKEIYKNSEGKYLVIFDKQGNHKDIERVATESKLECISDEGCDYTVIGDYHDGVVT